MLQEGVSDQPLAHFDEVSDPSATGTTYERAGRNGLHGLAKSFTETIQAKSRRQSS